MGDAEGIQACHICLPSARQLLSLLDARRATDSKKAKHLPCIVRLCAAIAMHGPACRYALRRAMPRARHAHTLRASPACTDDHRARRPGGAVDGRLAHAPVLRIAQAGALHEVRTALCTWAHRAPVPSAPCTAPRPCVPPRSFSNPGYSTRKFSVGLYALMGALAVLEAHRAPLQLRHPGPDG